MRVFNLWVVVRPAEDLPDQWVAHCLELDVISQGTSFQHAMAMVGEAAFLAVTEDLSAGRDPLLRRAPDEFWTDLYSIAASGEQVPYASLLKGVDGDFVEAIASQMVLQVAPLAIAEGKVLPPSFTVPLTWKGHSKTDIHP